MSKEHLINEEKKARALKPNHDTPEPDGSVDSAVDVHLQNYLGNRTLQRLLTQRTSDRPFDLDDLTTARINEARGRGEILDTALQRQLSQAMGHDFSGVRVHTSPEADSLNQQLSAKAFTTGQDIFFRQGEYDPGSSSGRELLTHELTHVVQQSSGAVGGGGSKMTVNPPGDIYEQEADAVAKQVVSREVSTGSGKSSPSSGSIGSVQRVNAPEDEALQMKALQRQEGIEDDEKVQKAVQRETMPEEEKQAQ